MVRGGGDGGTTKSEATVVVVVALSVEVRMGVVVAPC